MASATELLARLERLDACAVSDALDQLGEPDGVALGLAPLSTRRRIAGKIITVQLGPANGVAGRRHLCTSAIDAADDSSVIVVANDGRTDVGSWGGILSLGAVRARVRGVVLDGACRDIDEACELDLPVYGRGGVARTARGRVVELSWDVPVTIAGVAAAPGDLVIADASGVVFVRRERAEVVIGRAERIAAKERLMAGAVREGAPMTQVMGADYEHMLDGGSS